jgi:hypothetical protein
MTEGENSIKDNSGTCIDTYRQSASLKFFGYLCTKLNLVASKTI